MSWRLVLCVRQLCLEVKFHRKENCAKRDAFTSSIRPKYSCKYQVTTQGADCDIASVIGVHPELKEMFYKYFSITFVIYSVALL